MAKSSAAVAPGVILRVVYAYPFTVHLNAANQWLRDFARPATGRFTLYRQRDTAEAEIMARNIALRGGTAVMQVVDLFTDKGDDLAAFTPKTPDGMPVSDSGFVFDPAVA